MKIFDNISEIVRDDMADTIKKGSKVSVAAACFSMYAYKELKKQLEGVENFRSSSPHQLLRPKKPRKRRGSSIFRG